MSVRLAASQPGFSLIESLVALVVLSVGMVGIAALQVQGLGAGRTAQLRTLAVNLAADMADRIRANRNGLSAYTGIGSGSDCDPGSAGGADCTPAAVAARDLAEWTQEVATALPNGEGAVSFDATMPPSFTIQVSWDEVGTGNVTHRMVVHVAGS